jgi:hypothetical protein
VAQQYTDRYLLNNRDVTASLWSDWLHKQPIGRSHAVFVLLSTSPGPDEADALHSQGFWVYRSPTGRIRHEVASRERHVAVNDACATSGRPGTCQSLRSGVSLKSLYCTLLYYPFTLVAALLLLHVAQEPFFPAVGSASCWFPTRPLLGQTLYLVRLDDVETHTTAVHGDLSSQMLHPKAFSKATAARDCVGVGGGWDAVRLAARRPQVGIDKALHNSRQCTYSM